MKKSQLSKTSLQYRDLLQSKLPKLEIKTTFYSYEERHSLDDTKSTYQIEKVFVYRADIDDVTIGFRIKEFNDRETYIEAEYRKYRGNRMSIKVQNDPEPSYRGYYFSEDKLDSIVRQIKTIKTIGYEKES